MAYPPRIPYTVPTNALSVISMSISPVTLLCSAASAWDTVQSPDMLIFMDPAASDEYKHVAAETFDPLFTVIETAGSEPVLSYSMAPLYTPHTFPMDAPSTVMDIGVLVFSPYTPYT